MLKRKSLAIAAGIVSTQANKWKAKQLPNNMFRK